MKKIRSAIAYAMLLLTVFSCHQNEGKPIEQNPYVNRSTFAEEREFEKRNTQGRLPENVKLIKTGEARYKVKSVAKATSKIKKLTQQIGGYVSNLEFQNNRYTLENKLTLRMPQQQFDFMLDTLSTSVEYIDYEKISTKDVSEEYIDLTSRLQTKQEVKNRYENILRKQAKTVKDILEAEEKLGDIQEEIERAQGRLKYLENKVSYSTMIITIYETVSYKEKPVSYEKTFWTKTKQSFINGWDFLSLLVLAIINIWPVVFIAVGLFIFFRRRRRKKRSA